MVGTKESGAERHHACNRHVDRRWTRGRGDRAKVCGAGGGGCILLLAEPRDTAAVRDALLSGGAQLIDAAIDMEGLRVRRG